MKIRLQHGILGVSSLLLAIHVLTSDAQCNQKCDLALASYYVWEGTTLSFVSTALAVSVADIVSYNKDTIPNQDSVQSGVRINVPFACGCIREISNNEFLGHVFNYTVKEGDTYDTVARRYYSNLTTADWLRKFNSYPDSNIPNTAALNVTVNCSCGNSDISKDYGLFITYPLRPEDSLALIATAENISQSLLTQYNPGVNFDQGSGLVYIPGKGCASNQLCGN